MSLGSLRFFLSPGSRPDPPRHASCCRWHAPSRLRPDGLKSIPSGVTTGVFIVWVLSEAAFGIVAGVLVGLTPEAIVMGAQMLGLQAGYGYASTIDPNTQADSGILLVLAQLLAGLLFFALGLTVNWS